MISDVFFEDFGEQCDRFMMKIQNIKHLASIHFRDQIQEFELVGITKQSAYQGNSTRSTL